MPARLEIVMTEPTVSAMDRLFYGMIRENVTRFLAQSAARYDRPGRLLDIAPQVHEGAIAHFRQAPVLTLDKDPQAQADYRLDICEDNSAAVGAASFDFVVCTEVLEHTLNPFAAVAEIRRVLKPRGVLLATTPFNFRIHGPLPDCWRFTEHGLRELLKSFEIDELAALECDERWLMPIHYTVVARKPG
jgi:SAM-dependent methyltransferase